MSQHSEPWGPAAGPGGGTAGRASSGTRRPSGQASQEERSGASDGKGGQAAHATQRKGRHTGHATPQVETTRPLVRPALGPVPRRRNSSVQTAGVAVFVVLVFGVGALFAWRTEAPLKKGTAISAASNNGSSGSLASAARVTDSQAVGLGEADQSPDFEFVPEFTRTDSPARRHATHHNRQSRAEPVEAAAASDGRPAPLAQRFGNVSPSENTERTSTATSPTSGATTAAGGIIADFDPLMDLIENTIEVDSWDPVGLGTMQEFESGVSIDPSGLMHLRTAEAGATKLNAARAAGATVGSSNRADNTAGQAGSATRPSVDAAGPLRKVSLLRLMAEVRRHADAGTPLPDEIRNLAGLTAVRYMFVYPDERDIVLAGPAEDWQRDESSRAIGVTSGHAVLQLDDLMALVQAFHHGASVGCSIDPRQDGLRQFKEYLVASRGPVPVGRRQQWVQELRDRLGLQDISIWGVPAGSHAARVLVEADYRMKLIGFDLALTIPNIPSYFDLLEQNPAARRQNFESLRWWFTLNYDSVVANVETTAIELVGSPVKLLSENEFLTQTGQRVHTGTSEATNTQFARNFTDHFTELAETDPVFSALGGVFNLAVVAALIEEHDLAERAGWPAEWLAYGYPVPQGRAPETVESVMNYREFSSREFTAAVSGGVSVEPGRLVSNLARPADPKPLAEEQRHALRAPQANLPWWWD